MQAKQTTKKIDIQEESRDEVQTELPEDLAVTQKAIQEAQQAQQAAANKLLHDAIYDAVYDAVLKDSKAQQAKYQSMIKDAFHKSFQTNQAAIQIAVKQEVKKVLEQKRSWRGTFKRYKRFFAKPEISSSQQRSLRSIQPVERFDPIMVKKKWVYIGQQFHDQEGQLSENTSLLQLEDPKKK